MLFKIIKNKKLNYFLNKNLIFFKNYTSLIPETLQILEKEEKEKEIEEKKERLSLEERKKQRRNLSNIDIPSFDLYLKEKGLKIKRDNLQIFQMNITRYCNQACKHCHVESSPKRKEFMNEETFNQCIRILENSPSITSIDITGGAPELHPLFRSFVSQVRSNKKINPKIEIISRCNLTVLLEPGQEDLAQFYKDHSIRVIASLPCYSQQNVNNQRGNKVFERSIEALRRLNSIGYGLDNIQSPLLLLDLVYNPSGAFLPPNQENLEKQYKEILFNEYNIQFNHLLTITNMPINRFADQLYVSNKQSDYMKLLFTNFNPNTVQSVMCRNTINIDWDGIIYDCDFNQQIQLPLQPNHEHINNNNNNNENNNNEKNQKNYLTVFDIETANDLLAHHSIQLGNHCYGCTAGSGSSCQGSL